ncbi:MAG: hypothetical protein B7Y39_16420 [Bdellovibrio sp. 28-41-41]|nr:MAG: hypothetical protein B7Y39_16420 [Bdellovibrio sp. 28-41-41]
MKTITLGWAIALSFLFVGCSQFSEPQGLGNTANQNTNQKLGPVTKIDPTFESIKANILEKKCIACHNPEGDKEAKDIPLSTETDVVRGTSDSGDLIVAGDPNNSVLYQSVASYAAIRKKVKAMPPSTSKHAPLTGDEVMAIAAWITSLAPGSSGGDSPVELSSVSPIAGGQCPTVPVTTEPLIQEPSVIDYAFIKSQILDKKCTSCHKADGKADELVFGSRDEMVSLKNEFSQAMIVVGHPETSLLYLSLLKDKASRRDTRWMPPRKELNEGTSKDITSQETSLVKKWIEQGAR